MSEKKPKLNVKLLKRIKAYITKYPERYNQATWGRGENREGYFVPKPRLCDTQACIAGWAVFLTLPKQRSTYLAGNCSEIQTKATKLLGLTYGEALGLFDTNDGPDAGVEGAILGCEKIDKLIESRKTAGQ